MLVGTLAEGDGEERIVAVGEYDRLRDPAAAEAAFAVADELQGRGIGTRLLERLAALAAGQGIERFVAKFSPTIRPMLGVFESAGLEVTRELDGGEFEVSFPIAGDRAVPDARRRARPPRRDRLAPPVLRAELVAVIGALGRRGSIGGELFRNVLDCRLRRLRPTRSTAMASRSAACARIPRSPTCPMSSTLSSICLPGPLVLEAAEAALREA